MESKKKIYTVHPPLGYKLADESQMTAKEVREYVAGLVEDPKWKEHVLNNPFEEVLDCLVENGHEIEVGVLDEE